MIDWRLPLRLFKPLFPPKKQILLVCRENICRSPMAEGLLRRELELMGLGREIEVRSAGTQATQPGRHPDQRAERAAAIAGIDLSKIRSSRVTTGDVVRSDLVLAMDDSNLRDLRLLCPEEHQYKISSLLSHAPGQSLQEVPDPYYGSTEGFETVFELLENVIAEAAVELADQVLE